MAHDRPQLRAKCLPPQLPVPPCTPPPHGPAATRGPPHEPSTMTMDSGASHYFVSPTLASAVQYLRRLPESIPIVLPDASRTTGTHHGRLPLEGLPEGARECLLMPTFDGSLMSVARLCVGSTSYQRGFTAGRVLHSAGGLWLPRYPPPVDTALTLTLPICPMESASLVWQPLPL